MLNVDEDIRVGIFQVILRDASTSYPGVDAQSNTYTRTHTHIHSPMLYNTSL